MKLITRYLSFIAFLFFSIHPVFAVNISVGVEIIEINADDDSSLPPVPGDEIEWIELKNGTTFAIDVVGWDIDGALLSQVVGWGDMTAIPAGGIFVVVDTGDTADFVSRFGPADTSRFLGEAGFGSLTNGGEVITIDDVAGTVLDPVGLVQDFDYTPFTKGSNQSLIKLTFGSDEDQASSWQVGINGGNPFVDDTGAVAPPAPPAGLNELVISQSPFSPFNEPGPCTKDGGLGCDEGVISYRVRDGWLVTIRLFNIRGQEVRVLIAEETFAAGTNSCPPNVTPPSVDSLVCWDGRNSSGEIVPIGIYLVNMRATDTNTGATVDKTKTIIVGRKL